MRSRRTPHVATVLHPAPLAPAPHPTKHISNRECWRHSENPKPCDIAILQFTRCVGKVANLAVRGADGEIAPEIGVPDRDQAAGVLHGRHGGADMAYDSRIRPRIRPSIELEWTRKDTPRCTSIATLVGDAGSNSPTHCITSTLHKEATF